MSRYAETFAFPPCRMKPPELTENPRFPSGRACWSIVAVCRRTSAACRIAAVMRRRGWPDAQWLRPGLARAELRASKRLSCHYVREAANSQAARTCSCAVIASAARPATSSAATKLIAQLQRGSQTGRSRWRRAASITGGLKSRYLNRLSLVETPECSPARDAPWVVGAVQLLVASSLRAMIGARARAAVASLGTMTSTITRPTRISTQSLDWLRVSSLTR
jgi:hypothetical protein